MMSKDSNIFVLLEGHMQETLVIDIPKSLNLFSYAYKSRLNFGRKNIQKKASKNTAVKNSELAKKQLRNKK